MRRTYRTVQGDMWDLIAHTQLGSDAHVDKLINLNQQYIGYYIFPAGIVLKLPDIQPGTPAIAPPWKQVVG